ncbi:hypothetical protein WICMUC_004805 [Wickerhamomyces mucosus]|uniref:YMC020W-like alpha/beta hydrolase domain-containing protein n=1 Tax=Wickerhamomyces mucosus TaxID=1378264 RepID=A0A9P8TA85_9ASCO|nr:hypothetical protein WICMUC_004805 [Wickerhamomyces mucosus]
MSSNDKPNSNELSEGWKYWKQRQGSAESSNRKISTVDPLEVYANWGNTDGYLHQEQQQPDTLSPISETQDNQINNDVNNVGMPEQQNQVTWGNFWNPMTYIPQEIFNFPEHVIAKQTSSIEHDNLSTYSSATSRFNNTNQTWFSWIWAGQDKKIVNELDVNNQELITSVELKKNAKESKKAVANNDTCWAWYQNHYKTNEPKGELSVLGTKSEASPVELSKYPLEQISLKQDLGKIVPEIDQNYRKITRKTKIRLAAQLYYNFPVERHLYIKKKQHESPVRYALVISVVSYVNKPARYTSKQISDICVESIQEWFKTKDFDDEYQIESISLEAGYIKESSLEDLFKLLINWRVDFKKIDYLFINGYRQSFPLAVGLLDILLSRELVKSSIKIGLLGIDGLIPGSKNIITNSTNGLNDSNADIENFPYYKMFDFIISNLLSKFNVKVTFIGTLTNLSSSLGIQLSHPNIFRSVFIPKTSYNNDFETHLINIILTSHNLGYSGSRLLVQLTKYFHLYRNDIFEGLNIEIFKNAVENSLNTTNLINNQKLKINIINDEILNNEYNLIWTLHAFIDEFKNIKNISSLTKIKTLLALYKSWDPQLKGLKDLKYMLEVLKIEDYSGSILKD